MSLVQKRIGSLNLVVKLILKKKMDSRENRKIKTH